MRGHEWVTDIWQDLRYSVRSLWKRPGLMAVAILSLALGIGASTAIFSVVNSVLLASLPYESASRLVYVGTTWGDASEPTYASLPEYLDWKESLESVASLAASQPSSLVLTGGREPERVHAARVSPELFSTLGVRPMLGRMTMPEEHVSDGPAVAILSHALWTRRWGRDPSVVGKTFTAERGRSSGSYTVIGVMPPDYRSPAVLGPVDTDVWIPLPMDERARAGSRGSRSVRVIGRLPQRTSIETARLEANDLAIEQAEMYPGANVFEGVTLGIGVATLSSMTAGRVEAELLILLGASGLLLLIASANVSNLLLARTTRRRRELALRAALGAGRGTILRQLLVESVFVSLLGGLAAVLVADIAVSLFTTFGPDDFPRLAEVGLDWQALGFALALALVSGILAGILPALFGSKHDLSSAIKETSSRSSAEKGQVRPRNALVVAETALATVLLIGAGLLTSSFLRLRDVEPGFDTAEVLLTEVRFGAAHSTNESRAAFLERLVRRVGEIPGVVSASSVIDPPLGYIMYRPGVRLERAPDEPLISAAHLISPGYFQTMGIRLLHGRSFTWWDKSDTPLVAVVSESMAEELWPGSDPLRMRMRLSGPNSPWVTVVGVVADIHQEDLASTTPREFYVPHAQMTQFGWTNLVIRSAGTPAALASALRSAFSELDPNLPLDGITSMESRVASSLAGARFRTILLFFFATTSLVLAAAGLYGTLLYHVRRQTREIGIRMALGARPARVLEGVFRRGMSLTALGLILGTAAALATARILEGLLFSTTTTDPTTLVVVLLALASVAALACLLPACKATSVDPISALRDE